MWGYDSPWIDTEMKKIKSDEFMITASKHNLINKFIWELDQILFGKYEWITNNKYSLWRISDVQCNSCDMHDMTKYDF